MAISASKNDLVHLTTLSTDAEAHIVAGMLESEGIPTVLDNSVFGSSVYPIGFNSIGGIRLMVRSCDLNKAAALLESHGDSN